VDQSVSADNPRRVAVRRTSANRGKQLAPYLLSLPAGVWLLLLFIVPLATLLIESLETCSPVTGACTLTWSWGELPHQVSLYHQQFTTSLVFAAIATVIDLIISFPIAYWIAFYGGRRKNFFLIMLLVPFFVSFIIRTIVWEFILSENGVVLNFLRHVHLISANFHVLGTSTAVVAGLAYNYLPFTALPLYVAIERIDRRVLDAAYDLYANRRTAFMRVVLPLAIPGIFAAFLLTFIPAFGDYVNQEILGGTSNTMIGTVIQDSYLVNFNYPAGASLSVVLLAVSLLGIWLYARLLGSRTIEDYL
jgi:spermidine/putrescine transport system permease protein